jgi:cytochrome d ubiquinol oxidase subunit II
METFWFCVVAYMLAMYVVLDGFDLGTGLLHLFVARSEEERRAVLASIGPVWDGNEVWLLAAGGTLYFAFPLLYASSFSGFYLPLIIVLWLLMMRGLGIELRHQLDHPMWKAFWDVSFCAGSALLAIFFGAALGNVVRGVPLNAEGYFFVPLWTTFTVVPEAGVLDWFTVLMALVAAATLLLHGANYLLYKTSGPLQQRALRAAGWGWWFVVVFSAGAFLSSLAIRPGLLDNFSAHPWGYLFPSLAVAGLAGVSVFNRKGNHLRAFLSSSLFIIAMLSATAFALYPDVLPSSIHPSQSLTIYNTSTGEYGMKVGTIWWTIGTVLCLGYFTYLFSSFRGKVKMTGDEHGY